MIKSIFPHNFYTEIIPENKEELVYELENALPDENQHFQWQEGCKVELERLSVDQKYINLFKPTLDIFFEDLGETHRNFDPYRLGIYLSEIWRNNYKQGCFQEIHDHTPLHLSGVVFLTDEQEGDGRFFFYNRHSSEIPKEWKDLKVFPDDRLYINAERGKILLFPSYALHGVTIHKTDNPRVTVAFNISFDTSIPPEDSM